MYYIVQKNVFREQNYDIIFEALERLDLEYEVVDITDSLNFDYKTDRKDIFPFGSIRLANISRKNDWVPGSFFGGNHDFSIYSKYYKENLLNYDSEIKTFGDTLEWNNPSELKFIRPCKDSKLFTGQVFTRNKWEDLLEAKLQNKYYLDLDESQLIQVTIPRKIYKEARLWIVDGKIVTSSYYMFGDHVQYSEHVEPDGIEFGNKMISVFQVADAFVMDICLTPDGWKIVEINCVNCSGFYKCDVQKILIALENKYNPIEY